MGGVIRIVFLLLLLSASAGCAAELNLSLDPEAAAVVYSGQEKMRFSVSWSGGIEIGSLELSLSSAEPGKGQLITARATDHGLLKVIYPLDDTFVTNIRGAFKLPRRYDVKQLERGKSVQRLTVYSQRKFNAVYQKQKNLPKVYSFDGPVYNEFAAFFITRALRLKPEEQQLVPTFADEKRHLVPVKVFGKETKTTVFGTVRTVKVQPKMSFKGLYSKEGDTVFWLTDDACRVPVEIRSKILIGSLVAELVEYSNPACPLRLKPSAGKD